MKTIKTFELKARCIQLMDEVSETGEPLVITKNGKPVNQLVPYRRRPSTLFGALKGNVEVRGISCLLSMKLGKPFGDPHRYPRPRVAGLGTS